MPEISGGGYQYPKAVLDVLGVSYVVEQGSDGSGNWYRRFSNGWVEQGGSLGYGNALTPNTNTISFPVPFTEIPTILIGGAGYKGDQTYEGGIDSNSVSTTSFTYLGISHDPYYTNAFSWEAKGFAA